MITSRDPFFLVRTVSKIDWTSTVIGKAADTLTDSDSEWESAMERDCFNRHPVFCHLPERSEKVDRKFIIKR